MRTRSPTRKESPGCHLDHAVLLAEAGEAALRAQHDAVPARPRAQRVAGERLAARVDHRPSGAGTLTTVATTVSAQSSSSQVPSATCDASWKT